MKKKTNNQLAQFLKGLVILLLALSCNALTVTAQNVNIPDANFKAVLVGNPSININGDTEIQVIEASKYRGGIYCAYKDISSLVGIEAFTSFTILDCSNNFLNSLDVSKNTSLYELNCPYNQFTSIDVSKNILLTTLRFNKNNLESLDVSKNTLLIELDCSWNKITNLDVSKNTALAILFCGANQLTNLDLSKNISLTNLNAFFNQLTTLDVSKNTLLTIFNCSFNQLTSLDLSKNTLLIELDCSWNKLDNLDVSKNTSITTLHCSKNPLNILDLSRNMTLNILGCSSNQLKILDVTKNTLLTIFDCSFNQLTSLDLSKNTLITGLSLTDNQFASLDLSKNTSLRILHCYNNQLTKLDLSKNTLLAELYCESNELISLDVSKNPNLSILRCNSNPDLNCIVVRDVAKAISLWRWMKDATANYTLNDCALKILEDNKGEQSICPSETFSPISIHATGANILYQWYSTFDHVNTNGTKIVENAQASSYFPPSNLASLIYYYCVVTEGTETATSGLFGPFVVNTPASPAVASPVNYCVGDMAQALTATGVNLKWYALSNGGVGNVAAPIPSTTVAGNFNYYVTQTTGSCESNRSLITVTVNALPSIPAVASPVNFCVGGIAQTLTATGVNLKWYALSNGGVGNVAAPIPSTTVAGNFNYYVTQTTNSCESNRSLITVNVNALPSIPAVASSVNYCVGGITQALTATGVNLKWYTSSNGGVGNGTAPIPSTTVAGNFNYYVTQTVNTCESSRSIVTVYVNASPSTPTVITPNNYCVGDLAQALTATGISLKWYASPTGGVGNVAAPIPSTTVAGNFNYYVTQTTNTCESNRSLITVNVNALPGTPTVVSPNNYCVGDIAQALSATGVGLKWYTSPTGGVGNIAAPIPLTTSGGIFNYYVTQTNGLCESERSVVQVEVQSSPKPVVSGVVNYCKGNSANPLSATGSNLKWYTSPNAGVASAVAPVPVTSTSGVFLYYVSQQTATCESERVAIVVNVNPSIDVPTVISPLDYCVGSTASPLVASGSNLKWYTTQNGTTSSSLAITPSTSTIGSTHYYVSQSYNGCESVRSSIAVNIQQAPSAPTAVSPVNYCLGSVASPLSAVGSNLYWYASSASCSGFGMSPLPSTSTTGLTSYFVSQKLNGCESPKKEIVVSVTNSGTAPIVVSPVSVFVGVNASALTASGTNLKWYSSATDNIGTTVAPIPSTAVAGMTDYYVSQTINGCESARALIKVLVNGDISAPTCFNLGGTYPFELSPVNTVNATNYTWWVNGSVQSISASSNSPKAIISVGQYYSTGQVCAGINYSQAPWYKQVCTTIDLCGNASSRIGGVAPITFVNISPNPTFDQFSIKTSTNVQQVTIKNMLGQNVYTIGDMSTDQTVNFGTELATGMYIIQYKISDGSSHTVSIIKQ